MGQTIVTAPDGKKYRVTHPDGASNDEIQRQLQNNLGQTADDGSAQLGDIPRGFAKGMLGDVRGAAQLAPSWTKSAIREIPGEASVESFAKTPSRSLLESGSEIAGAIAPFAAAEVASGGGATPLSAALWGAASGAAQPTSSGSLLSHALGAGFGAAGGAATAPAVAGKIAQVGGVGLTWAALEHLAGMTGRSAWELALELGVLGGGASHFMGHGLSGIARRAGVLAEKAGRKVAPYVPASFTGTTASEVPQAVTQPLSK